MSQTPSSQYLRTQVMTASPEALQLMLWDGAIRFAEQGKQAIINKDIEGSYNALLRSQKIIMEMNGSLKHEIAPELCKNLAALYNFIYRQLVDANVKKETKYVDDALRIMRHQRETWVMLMEKLAREKAGGAAAEPDAVDTAHENAAATIQSSDLAQLPRAPRRTGYPGVKAVALPSVTLSVQG